MGLQTEGAGEAGFICSLQVVFVSVASMLAAGKVRRRGRWTTHFTPSRQCSLTPNHFPPPLSPLPHSQMDVRGIISALVAVLGVVCSRASLIQEVLVI